MRSLHWQVEAESRIGPTLTGVGVPKRGQIQLAVIGMKMAQITYAAPAGV
jgi:hypothetical protein